MNNYDWYKEVPNNEPLTQGDILLDFPVPVIESSDEHPFFKVSGAEFDVVVMTQACDLENNKVENISFCILEPVEDIVKKIFISQTGLKSADLNNLSGKAKSRPEKILAELKKGQHINYHLLNSNLSGNVEMKHKVVHLKGTYGMPVKSANDLLTANQDNKYNKRLRLLPPYREHLSQSYANIYGRIGLPIDIDIEKITLSF